MKINPFTDPFRFMTSVRTQRSEGEGGNARQEYDPNHSKKDEDPSHQKPKTPEEYKARLEAALESFRVDALTMANGLSASAEGTGLGLKVAVRDINGNTLRQFTGEEFLRLRETTGKDARSRGKILDQKL